MGLYCHSAPVLMRIVCDNGPRGSAHPEVTLYYVL